jgi:hypothetical protein
MRIHLPFLMTGDRTVDKAFRIAVGDFVGNIHPYRGGLVATEKPMVLAGIHYADPWIRDASFNVWNGASLIAPEASRDTLLSTVCPSDDGLLRVGYKTYHYWDAIVCVTGFWQHFLYTGDRGFLQLAFDAARNTLAYFEETEFDAEDGLFRGPACCMDAISAYPDELAYPVKQRSDYTGILGCLPTIPRARMAAKGVGLPFKALSTNCLYYEAYRDLDRMAAALNVTPVPDWSEKARNLKRAINARFWIEEEQRYAYLVSCPKGPETCIHQEGLGHSLVLLFGLADDERKMAVLAHQHLEPAGIPYVWPTFPRYAKYGAQEYGRASGTVWPHVQAFWADAAAANGRMDLFLREFRLMAEHAERDSHFAEVLHPKTGEIYGGVQEVNFTSKPRQTWCATGFIRLVLRGLVGMDFGPDGIGFTPWLPDGMPELILRDLHYRRAVLTIRVHGHGGVIRRFTLNGTRQARAFVAATTEGDNALDVELGGNGPCTDL